MLLDNEDKISVSISSLCLSSQMFACVTRPPFRPVHVMFVTGLLIHGGLFV